MGVHCYTNINSNCALVSKGTRSSDVNCNCQSQTWTDLDSLPHVVFVVLGVATLHTILNLPHNFGHHTKRSCPQLQHPTHHHLHSPCRIHTSPAGGFEISCKHREIKRSNSQAQDTTYSNRCWELRSSSLSKTINAEVHTSSRNCASIEVVGLQGLFSESLCV